MKWARDAAIVNLVIVVCWIALGLIGTIGTTQLLYYALLPAAFLIAPLVVIAVHRIWRSRAKNEEMWGGIGCSALLLNLFLFFGYLMMAGGGM